MRIKGIDPDKAPESLKPVFENSLQQFGRIITPSLVMGHRPELLLAAGRLNAAVARSTVVEPRLKSLAFIRTAQMIGCPF